MGCERQQTAPMVVVKGEDLGQRPWTEEITSRP